MNDFESELKKQPLRRVPSHWRVAILAAAKIAKPEPRATWQWWDLLWPSPKAWGTLAAAWVLMVCFHIAMAERGGSPEQSQAVQIRMAVEQKRRLQAEIEEAAVHLDGETTKPRSEVIHGTLSA
jgi:hypothetical protein